MSWREVLPLAATCDAAALKGASAACKEDAGAIENWTCMQSHASLAQWEAAGAQCAKDGGVACAGAAKTLHDWQAGTDLSSIFGSYMQGVCSKEKAPNVAPDFTSAFADAVCPTSHQCFIAQKDRLTVVLLTLLVCIVCLALGYGMGRAAGAK